MKKPIAGLVATLCVASAFAQEPARLAKPEVEVMVVGKKIWYQRALDDAKISWDFKPDGVVYYGSPKIRRNLQLSGTYTITERGGVCFKWNVDKEVAMKDGCIGFRRDGEKLQIVGGGDPPRVLGDVVPE